MDLKFVARGVMFGVPVALVLILIGFAIIVFRTPFGRPPDPTPWPPTIVAPRGEIPQGPVGLAEYVHYRSHGYVPAGSGFLLNLESGDRVGVTTAHSLDLGNPDRPLDRVAFRIPGVPGDAVLFDALYGTPGRAVRGSALSADVALLCVDGAVDPALFLAPDPRGGPQPGERVSLLSGNQGRPGRRYELTGTVVSADERAAWALMDKETFDPRLMSGSPFISQHTGQVVGMVVAGSPRHVRLIPPGYRVLLGMHPIGSIVERAEEADTFPALSTYRP